MIICLGGVQAQKYVNVPLCVRGGSGGGEMAWPIFINLQTLWVESRGWDIDRKSGCGREESERED